MRKFRKKKIVIVGAGFAGLKAAKTALDAGHDVLIIERKQGIGGVWRDYANKTSRVQIVEPVYHFDIPGKNVNKILTDFTPRDEILANAAEFFQYYGLDKITLFNAELTRLSDYSETKVIVTYKINGENYHILADGVLVLTGALSHPKKKEYPFEKEFQGKIALGIGDDFPPQEFQNKDVLVLGSGAFAIENARTALEFGAKSITILCHSYNMIQTRYADFVTEYNCIYGQNQLLNLALTAVNFVQDERFLSKFVNDRTIAQRAVYPISDIFWIATYYGKIKTIRGEIERFHSHGVITHDKLNIRADIVLKCLGFQPDSEMENILSFNYLQGLNVNGRNNVMYITEASLGIRKMASSFKTSSYLVFLEMIIDTFFYHLEFRFSYEKIKDYFPINTSLTLDGQYFESYLKLCARHDPILRYHILNRKIKAMEKVRERYSEGEFLSINQREWMEWCRKCADSSTNKYIPPYPNRPLLSGFRMYLQNLLARMIKYKFKKVSIYEESQPVTRINIGEFQPIHRITEEMVHVRDNLLYVAERGKGPPILLIPGALQNSYAWHDVANSLSQKNRVFTFDFRGLGRSGHCLDGFDIKTLANDVKVILDHYEIGNATIVGYDLGGLVREIA